MIFIYAGYAFYNIFMMTFFVTHFICNLALKITIGAAYRELQIYKTK